MPETFIKVSLSDAVNRAAERKAIEKGVLNRFTWGGVATNKVGILGEHLVRAWLAKFGATIADTRDYDILVDGLRLEVKSKGRNVHPRRDFDASLAAYNTRQQTDFYVCTSFVADGESEMDGHVFQNFSHGYICGIVTPEEFKSRGRFYAKLSEPWVQYDCYTMSFKDMMTPAEFVAFLRERRSDEVIAKLAS